MVSCIVMTTQLVMSQTTLQVFVMIYSTENLTTLPHNTALGLSQANIESEN